MMKEKKSILGVLRVKEEKVYFVVEELIKKLNEVIKVY